jgi:hypothetical protein
MKKKKSRVATKKEIAEAVNLALSNYYTLILGVGKQ